MLTDKEVDVLQKLFYICSKIHIVPITWNKTTHLSILKSRTQSALLNFSFLVSLCLAVDNLIRIFRSISQSDYDFVVVYSVGAVATISSTVYKILVHLYLEEFVCLVNQIIKLNSELKSNEKTETATSQANAATRLKLRSRLFQSISIYYYITAFSFLPIYMGFMYKTSFYNCEYPLLCNGIFVAVASSTILTWIDWVPCGVMLIQSILASLLLIKYWVHLTCVKWPRDEAQRPIETNVNLESVQNWIKMHKIMFLLNNLFNKSFGQTILPLFQNALTLVIWVTVYAIIILRSQFNLYSFIVLGIILGAAITLLTVQLFQTSALFDDASKFKTNMTHVITRVEDSNVRKIHLKQVKAQQVIRCQIGKFYYMESEAKLTTIDNIVHGIVFLLVSAKK